jgi:thioesterase domain-containing protein
MAETPVASEQLRTPTQIHATHARAIEAALAELATQCRNMPPVAAMGVHPLDYDGRTLRLGAPLPANVNDKGCAFGGSLCGLMTLAAWGWVMVNLKLAGHDGAEIYVADSQIRYLAPLYEDLVAEAAPAEGEQWTQFLRTFEQRGKARISMQARVPIRAGGEATLFSGRFVAIRRGN